MSEMTLKDGTPLPEPTNKEVHRYSFHKTSLGYTVECKVVEVEFPSFLMLNASVNHPEVWDWVLADYLGRIVAQKISTGKWTLHSLSATSAVMFQVKEETV